MKVRLLADDLTGALDTAVRLLPLTDLLPVVWQRPQARHVTGSVAVDLGTREMGEKAVHARTAAAVALLADADVAFLKCDSLMRGAVALQIEACLATGLFAHCVIAPAFPAQGRVTRDGRQYVADGTSGDRWLAVGSDLPSQLVAHGKSVAVCRPDEVAPHGVSFWDSENDAQLDHVVAAGRHLSGRVLWCGSAGLARALAGVPPPAIDGVAQPLLALVGSDHAITAAQVARTADWNVVLDPGCGSDFAKVAARLDAARAAVVTVRLPSGVERSAASRHITDVFARAVRVLPQPATLFVTGGETLRGVCEALAGTRLLMQGEISAGLPSSRLDDGAWAGTTVISKSGAFGDAGLLSRLTAFARR